MFVSTSLVSFLTFHESNMYLLFKRKYNESTVIMILYALTRFQTIIKNNCT